MHDRLYKDKLNPDTRMMQLLMKYLALWCPSELFFGVPETIFSTLVDFDHDDNKETSKSESIHLMVKPNKKFPYFVIRLEVDRILGENKYPLEILSVGYELFLSP